MEDLGHHLKKALLQDLEPAELERLMARLVLEKKEAGVVLYEDGEPARGMYFLLSGRLAVQKKTSFAGKYQVVALLEEGAIVGERGVFEGQNRSCKMVAVEACQLFFLSAASYREMQISDQQLAVKLLGSLLQSTALRLDFCTSRLVHVL